MTRGVDSRGEVASWPSSSQKAGFGGPAGKLPGVAVHLPPPLLSPLSSPTHPRGPPRCSRVQGSGDKVGTVDTHVLSSGP